MKIEALLVDMDGTLVDTAEANYAAYSEALAEAGVAVTREEFDAVAPGRNWRQFLPPILEAAGSRADPERIAGRKAKLYPDKLHLTKVNEALRVLIANGRPGWRTALVTTASAANVAAVLGQHRLESLFDIIVTGSDVTRHKPDPEAYEVAASRLGVAPEACLIVEDSDIGMASASAFGARCLQIRFEPRS